MKRYYAAAGALLLGTSALAWAGDANKIVVDPVKAEAATDLSWDKTALAAKSDMSWDKSLLATKSDLGSTDDSKFAFASLDKELEPLASAESDAKLVMASADSGWSDKVQTASMDDKVETSWSDSDKVLTASADADSKVETASIKVETGMGGPLEEETASVSPVVSQPSNANPELDARGIPVISDVAFVPPGYNGTTGAVGGPDEGGDSESYPACTAEVTDNCIQLYERGVTAAAADDKSETSAMGGPYEPVDNGTELAMNGDGTIDVDKGEISDSDVKTVAVPTETAVADHREYQGVGGPVEAQSGYPPCSPGPGDDRCIQLYESGVTGASN